ncbi:ribonuclease H-like domain-containing protein [Lineolata rhizophorae]|uniref:Ribonuclease H-like domain-containing protein n=1 Tax=Lineolata rhizophorae TaxID=578093 RepID=A0A6A6NY26_9PEZI|nr:ribonuclease H-like domain-containing protein [Lineolata rhizophorae]
MVNGLKDLPTGHPQLYLDIEGVNLGRNGSISIVQMYVLQRRHTYLVDVYTLNEVAFTTAAPDGRTFKDILEDGEIPKVFFDCRRDSDALFAHFGVRLARVLDLQLLEVAGTLRGRVSGLFYLIRACESIGTEDKDEWCRIKDVGKQIFNNGQWEKFNQRPMPAEIRQYCLQDVVFLPILWSVYRAQFDTMSRPTRWARKVIKSSNDRVAESQSPDFKDLGWAMAYVPKDWPVDPEW